MRSPTHNRVHWLADHNLGFEGTALGQLLDRVGLGHNTFTPEALALIVRSGEALLRRTRNLCLGALIETVRDQSIRFPSGCPPHAIGRRRGIALEQHPGRRQMFAHHYALRKMFPIIGSEVYSPPSELFCQ